MSELAVITGTTHGIGRVTSRELARAGKTVVMLCRDVTAGRAVRAEIVRHVPGARVEVVHCDLASLASVRQAAAAVRRDYPPVGLLVKSKLVNVMHTFALARRMAGTGIGVNCLHPGVVATNLLPRWLRVLKPLITRGVFDAERGARTTLYLALDPGVAGVTGRYFDECQMPRAAAALADDVGLQESLWNASAEWTRAPQRPKNARCYLTGGSS